MLARWGLSKQNLPTDSRKEISMSGKKSDNSQVERVDAFGCIDVEFTGGPEPQVFIAAFKEGSPYSRVRLDSNHINDLIGALRRARNKLLKAE